MLACSESDAWACRQLYKSVHVNNDLKRFPLFLLLLLIHFFCLFQIVIKVGWEEGEEEADVEEVEVKAEAEEKGEKEMYRRNKQ